MTGETVRVLQGMATEAVVDCMFRDGEHGERSMWSQLLRWQHPSWIKEVESHLTNGRCSANHPQLKDWVFKTPAGDVTPLVLACQGGNLEVVKHIVEQWGADVNKASVCELFGARVEAATPLLVATAERFEKTVRYLIDKGADVNLATATSSERYGGMTPLHAAVTIPNEFLPGPYFGLIGLFLSRGANFRLTDADGLSPFHLAAIGGDSYDLLITFGLSYFLKHAALSVKERIEILELAGSTILTNTPYFSSAEKAFKYWNHATKLRLEADPPIPKVQLFANRSIEWTNLTELELLRCNPAEYKQQSYLVRLRILSRISAAAVKNHFWPYAKSYTSKLLNRSDFSRFFDMSWAILEATSNYYPKETTALNMTVEVCAKLVHGLRMLRAESNHPLLRSETFLKTLNLITKLDEQLKNSESSSVRAECPTEETEDLLVKHAETVSKFIEIISSQPVWITEETMDCLRLLAKRHDSGAYGSNLRTISLEPSESGHISFPLTPILMHLREDESSTGFTGGKTSNCHFPAQRIESVSCNLNNSA